MQDHSSTRVPITHMPIPQPAPTKVATPHGEYIGRSDAYVAKRNERRDAEQARKDAIFSERQRLEAAALAGKPAESHIADITATWDAKLAALNDEEAALARAVDTLGNVVAKAVVENFDEYLAMLDPAEADALERFAEALGLMREAASDLGKARQSKQWLSVFDYGEAVAGFVPSFGDRINVNTSGLRRETRTPISKVLDMLAEEVR